MSALPYAERLSEVEYLALELKSDIKHEFIDGYLYAMTGASEAHIRISGNIFAVLHGRLRGSSCTVYNSDMRVRIAATGNYTYPDVTVVCGERRFGDDEHIATLLNPTLIIEVLSPTTEGYDRGKKFHEYQTLSSLQDYVLVAQDAARIECFSRGESDTWILTQAEGIDSVMMLSSIDVALSLADVYEQVDING